jgi:pimeloyl-ACP methyl ester carboxylesterase
MRDQLLTLSDGRQLAYTDAGPADGPVVLYFHGAPSSRLDLHATGIADRLDELGVRAVSPDRPGYGLSTPQPGRTMDQWPNDVAALADHLGIERFAVVGASSGGPYAVATAAILGRRIVGCGVVAGVTDMGWEPAWSGYLEHEAAVMRQPDEHTAIAFCEERYGRDGAGLLTDETTEFAPSDLEMFEDEAIAAGFFATSSEAIRQGVAGVAQDMWLQGRPWQFDPAACSAKCIVLHGEADTIVPFAHGRHTAAVVPGAELVAYPDHGHLSIITEIPDLAIALLRPIQ